MGGSANPLPRTMRHAERLSDRQLRGRGERPQRSDPATPGRDLQGGTPIGCLLPEGGRGSRRVVGGGRLRGTGPLSVRLAPRRDPAVKGGAHFACDEAVQEGPLLHTPAVNAPWWTKVQT